MILLALLCQFPAAQAQPEPLRKVIIDEDAMGPGTTGQQAILMVLQDSQVETLGITITSGDGWRDEEVAHTLRMLELTGHATIPVIPGAIQPLLNSKADTARRELLYGRILYQGAWTSSQSQIPSYVPPLKEGATTLKPADDDAAHFMIKMVRRYPHQVSILAAGPLTNIALAIAIDPDFPKLAKELVFNGARINPQGIPDKYGEGLSHEFNFWWDPEAAHIVLRAPWSRIECSPIDVTIKSFMSPALLAHIAKGTSPTAAYVGTYGTADIMWDELTFAAWLDPSIVRKRATFFMDAEIDHGASYGNTITWYPGSNPDPAQTPVTVNLDIYPDRFFALFANLIRDGRTGP